MRVESVSVVPKSLEFFFIEPTEKVNTEIVVRYTNRADSLEVFTDYVRDFCNRFIFAETSSHRLNERFLMTSKCVPSSRRNTRERKLFCRSTT